MAMQQTIMSAKAATGIGTPIFVEDFDHAVIEVNTASNASLTLKVQISNSEDMPDFAAAQSSANKWDYVEVVDLNDSSNVYDGSTGIVLTGTDINKNLEVNVNGARWLCLIITARAAGTVTGEVRCFKGKSGRS